MTTTVRAMNLAARLLELVSAMLLELDTCQTLNEKGECAMRYEQALRAVWLSPDEDWLDAPADLRGSS